MFNKEILAVLIAYLLGSVPFAYIVARATRGIDIRQTGAGNVGAMNVWREAGASAGASVLVLDAAKGSLAILFANTLGVPLFVVMVSGVAAIIGHNWPVFLQFQGGRGAATTLGVMLAVMPAQFGLSFFMIAGLFLATGNTGLVMGVGLITLALAAWLTGIGKVYAAFPLVLAVLGLLRNMADFKKELTKSNSVKTTVFGRLPLPWAKRKE